MAETYLQFVIGLFVIDSFGQDGFDPLAQVRNQELESEFWFHIGACFAYSSHSVGKNTFFLFESTSNIRNPKTWSSYIAPATAGSRILEST